jgi:putative endonuclease
LTRRTRAATWRALPAPGEVAEWLKAADCKSARASVRWFESSPLHHPASLFELRRIGGKLRAKQDVLRSFSEGGLPVFSVYLTASVAAEGQRYVGSTADLKLRLQQHNAGQSAHTAKYKPWRIVSYVAFSNRAKAEAFERYLKSGSGHAFAAKRLW